MFRWWGQLKALWDLARQLVELREEIQLCNARLDELFQTLNTVNERTRKQDYRARKADEYAVFTPPHTAAIPGGARSDMIRQARAKGLLL